MNLKEILTSGNWIGPDHWALINASSDNQLIEILPHMTGGSSQGIKEANRDMVIALLNSRSSKVIIELTVILKRLTWVIVVLTFIMTGLAFLPLIHK